MFGGGPSNLAWFQLGKWSEENARRSRRSAALLWGNRPVEVDQSYIDELHNAHHRESELADHNYKLRPIGGMRLSVYELPSRTGKPS